jgi:ssDNA-binding Zn-finger/Zn-ribbon topoisomerase 1
MLAGVVQTRAIKPKSPLACPRCGETALNRYGRGPSGKQRFRCLVCGRQFTAGARRPVTEHRPDCPVCAHPMHVYRREPGSIRFRCARYPECRTFTKVPRP